METLRNIEELGALIITKGTEEMVFRLKIHSTEEWDKWLESFSEISNTSWNVYRTFPRPKRYVFRKTFKCHLNQYRQHETSANKSNTLCPVTMDVKIKLNTKSTKQSDKLVSTHPCIVSVTGNHNHLLQAAGNLGQLKISESTKQIFFLYFQQGLSPSQAMQTHETKLLVTDGISAVANNCLNPKSRSIYYLWDEWRKSNFGAFSGLNLFCAIQKYAKESEAKICLEQFEGSYVCAIVSPIMERIHKMMIQSSEIVFVDSTSNLDQTNASLTVLLCGSPIGALPLGAIISSGQDQRCFTKGLQLLKTMLGEFGFHYTCSPKVFMTDDCAAETNALHEVWPDSSQLLCIFHVLQAVWRWLFAVKNAIHKDLRPTFMKAFQKILYSQTEEDCLNAHSDLTNLCESRQCHLFLRYVDHWMAKKEKWCLAYRNGLLTRGQNTNNCCESTIRIIKDIVFNRCKAYNACQLLHFVTEVYSIYFVNRILNVILNRKKKITLESPPLDVDKISPTDTPTLFTVRSEKDDNVSYAVDVACGMCTCPVGVSGDMCKHQKSVILHGHLHSDQLYQGSASQKHMYASVALGQEHAPSVEFFGELASTSIQDHGSCSIAMEINPPSSSFNNTAGPSHQPVTACPDYTTGSISLFEECSELLKTKLSSDFHSKETYEALERYKNSISSARSVAQLRSALHSFGRNSIGNRNAGRKIKCQPTAIARRRLGISRTSAPLGKGRPPSQLIRKTKRPRHLTANINNNLPNATGH
uniref:Uncharacterized protein LOC104265534 n=1 Tax=Phallusia mammillata TaxID=59560 RepID=A0A6F9DJH5_9ASCI|nr:uncharacterized protein LOC104265534 [Phallusia mammillata]